MARDEHGGGCKAQFRLLGGKARQGMYTAYKDIARDYS